MPNPIQEFTKRKLAREDEQREKKLEAELLAGVLLAVMHFVQRSFFFFFFIEQTQLVVCPFLNAY